MPSQSTRDKDLFRLGHMIEYSTLLVHFGSLKTVEDLRNDVSLSWALVKLIENVGEAANHVSASTMGMAPNIPWIDIIGIRNRLIHGYSQIDFSIVVETIDKRVPELIEELLLLRQKVASNVE